jgi:ABC-2 type transport system permease protein
MRASMMRIVLSSLVQLVLARWRNFYRVPENLFWMFLFPVIMALVLGMAFREGHPEPVRIAVVRGAGSDAIYAAFSQSKDANAVLVDEAEALTQLRSAAVDLVIQPAAPGQPRRYRFDPGREQGRLARIVADDLVQRSQGRVDPTRVHDETVRAVGERYIDFAIPGLLGLSIMTFGLGIPLAIAEMRSRQLLKRLAVSPMPRTHFLLSLVIQRSLLLLVQLPMLLVVVWLMFGVRNRGSYFLLYACCLLGTAVFTSIGTLAAARVRSLHTARGVTDLIRLPMMIACGVFFSIDRLPMVVRPLVRLLPLSALIESLRAVMNHGAGVSSITQPLTIVTAWGLVSLTATVAFFRWQ